MTLGLKMQMQDARNRAWTVDEVAEAFGVCAKTVKSSTHAEVQGLTRTQRSTLRWSWETHGGMLSAYVLSRRDEIRHKNALKRLRRLQKKGYIERLPLDMLAGTRFAELGYPVQVWGLTRLGIRAAKDRLMVLA